MTLAQIRLRRCADCSRKLVCTFVLTRYRLDVLTFLLDNIFIRFGTKLYRQVVGIPVGTYCAPLFADLFLFCYESDFLMFLSDYKQADIMVFYRYIRYSNDILNNNNVYFDNMVTHTRFENVLKTL